MQEPPMLEELVDRVLLAVRDMTPRDTIELGVLHGFCLDTAKDLYPERVRFSRVQEDWRTLSRSSGVDPMSSFPIATTSPAGALRRAMPQMLDSRASNPADLTEAEVWLINYSNQT